MAQAEEKRPCEKFPLLRAVSGIHYALALIVRDDHFKKHELYSDIKDEAEEDEGDEHINFAMWLAFRDLVHRSGWPRARIGFVYNRHRQTLRAIILAHNATIEDRRPPSTELVDTMKAALGITNDPNWYRVFEGSKTCL
ncbi:hypothetical protein E1B28_008302 [Marasmius oreades]|uniref:Uncharacterized protein n=1 Tax=Marasmius oreades TaxID=181124 RepID=A0A9P7RY90_9AGAR|nr:uncharacterized protein E1B28_008302 [Marasmius oreades]KAG7091905.1 hypothetical protein E1B28_008302 [Marasmius oreades]